MAYTDPPRYPRIHADDFATVHERFNFTIDAAADPWSARLPRYWTLSDNGLAQSWAGERVWCHPPFEEPLPWMQKAQEDDVELAVLLLPERPIELWHGYSKVLHSTGIARAERRPAGAYRLEDPDGSVYPVPYSTFLLIFGSADNQPEIQLHKETA